MNFAPPTMDINAQKVFAALALIRQRSPLVHNITNFVVMNATANALLALGAAPVMAHAPEELAQMVSLAQALVINIGTLDHTWGAAMQKAMQEAAKQKIPIILDPVGAGATDYRTRTVQTLLQSAPVAVLRGNASEIMALHDATVGARGVDSQHDSSFALTAAHALAAQYNCVVSVSGATDHIVYQKQHAQVRNGHPLMTRITGMGCSASCVTAACCAVNHNYFEAATHAMAIMGICGEIAQKKSHGPGSLHSTFLDQLYQLDHPTIARHLLLELT